MPQMSFAKSLANTDIDWNPLAGWTYEYLPFAAHVRVIVNSVTPTALGNITWAVYSGSECIQDKSPVAAGGTAGVMPSELNYPPLDFQAPAGDRIRLVFNSADGTARAVQGTVVIQPL
jgi:hypothetical protein